MLHRQITPGLRALPPMTAQIATALGPALDEPGALQQPRTVHVSFGSDSDLRTTSIRCPVCPKADVAGHFMRTRPSVPIPKFASIRSEL
jgi:hypothetical protein